jgi:hypothetical protein
MPQGKARFKESEAEMIRRTIKKNLESRMLGNLHVRFGVGGGVQLPALHHIECIKQYATSKCLIYCDPPYIFGTRVSLDAYKHEYTDAQHELLVKTLLEVPGHKILSGYESPIYQSLLDAGWSLEKKDYVCFTSPNKKRRTECLYCSPNEELTNEENQHGNRFFSRMG